MALFRSGSRRRSLKSALRDATVVLAGTLLGILLSHMFFNDRGSERGIAELERLCADSGNARLLHLTKRSDDKLRDLRSRTATRLQPRPLPAGWVAGIEGATGRGSGTLVAAREGGEERDRGSGDSGSGETSVSDGSGRPQSTKHLLEDDATSQTTSELYGV